MNTTAKATQFLKTIYQDTWEKYSTEGLLKHYDKKAFSRSTGRHLQFEELYYMLEQNTEVLSFMRPEYHEVVAYNDHQFAAWFTTIHHDHNLKEVFRIHTMANYTVKDDKVVTVDFLWDKDIDFVLNYAKQSKTALAIKHIAGQKLTQRELQCFYHLIQGYTAKEIAIKLGISMRTTEAHISNIKNKLELHSIRDIIDFAITHGYLAIAPLFTEGK